MLAVVCLAQFMVILDVAIVNVALPSIDDGLHFSNVGLQWVVNAYTLTFAGFLMLGGRAADLLGRRRVFLVGTALFALSSLACALADSRGLLIGARALQGFGGAVLSPATLSIISSSFAEGRERNRALGIWGATGALGASSGALVGGLLTQTLGWQAIFAINVPIGLAIIVSGLRVLPASPAHDGPRHFDVAGAVLVTGGLVALAYGIVRSDTLGWASAGVIGPIASAVVLLAAFVHVEAHVASAPLVPLSIFRHGQLRTANVVVVLLYAAFFPVWFFLTIYLQRGHGLRRAAGRRRVPADDALDLRRVRARAARRRAHRDPARDRLRDGHRRRRDAAADRPAPGRGLLRRRPRGRRAHRARHGLLARPRDDRRDGGRPRVPRAGSPRAC